MAEDTTTQTTGTTDDGTGTNAGTTTPPPSGKTPRTFSEEEVNSIISDRLSRQQRAIDAKTVGEKAAAEAAKLAEQGEFKKLAETAQAERDALKATLTQRDHTDLQRTIAAEHGLPAEMASRLQGETREELVTDAKALAKLVAQPPAPPTPGNRPNPRPQAGPDQAQETEKLLRATGRYQAI